MVTIIIKEDKEYYACDKCGLLYLSNKVANDCEDWCKNNPNTCHIEISASAILI